MPTFGELASLFVNPVPISVFPYTPANLSLWTKKGYIDVLFDATNNTYRLSGTDRTHAGSRQVWCVRGPG